MKARWLEVGAVTVAAIVASVAAVAVLGLLDGQADDTAAGAGRQTAAGAGSSPAPQAGVTGQTRPVVSVAGDAPAGSHPGAAPAPASTSTSAATSTPSSTSAQTSTSRDGTTPSTVTTAPTGSSTSRPASTASTGGRTGRFETLPPGASLPSSAECAARVRPVGETVPENEPYNRTRGRRVTGTYLSTNTAIAATDYEQRLDGDFVGSTDEIIQWAACKWGFDEDLVRAQVYTESSWYAGKLGDCGEQARERTGGAGGCASVGLIQVRSAEAGHTDHPGVFPIVLDSAAMNLDYGLAVMRLCYEGKESWLAQVSSAPGGYQAGDHWNCMGRWFSGNFGDSGAKQYIGWVQQNLADRPWERSAGRGCPNWEQSFHCSGR